MTISTGPSGALEPIHEKIDRLLRDCSEKDWDGYQADPLQPESAKLAHAIADAVSAFAPDWAQSNVVPENEGGYEWEWDADGGTYFVTAHFIPDEPPKDPQSIAVRAID